MTVAVDARIGALRRRLAARLDRAFAAGGRQGTATLDARILLAHVLGVDAAGLALHDDESVDALSESRAIAYVERRIAGEPVARIVGRREFWGLDFELGPDTLVPRPDTETVVEAALAFLDRAGRRSEALKLLDIGTGSGAILLALLSELPAASGTAIDRLPGALSVARRNAGRLDLEKQVCFVVSDWATAVGGGFDLVLANPPYIETGAIVGLQVEVADHDPHFALDGGADGLEAYRAILGDLDRLLAPSGRGFLEVGYDQARAVAELGGNHGFSARFHRDLGGIERVVEFDRAQEN